MSRSHIPALAFALAIAATAMVPSCAIENQPPRETLPCSEVAPSRATRAITAREFKVARIIDGDTFVIFYDGELTSCRIAGIDAPELRSVEGEESREGLTGLIGAVGGVVTISFPARRKRDHFGRLLVGVTSGGVDIAAAMIADGWAVRRSID